jgi:hypothetical protein
MRHSGRDCSSPPLTPDVTAARAILAGKLGPVVVLEKLLGQHFAGRRGKIDNELAVPNSRS